MYETTFPVVTQTLTTTFRVPPEKISLQASLQALDLDSLTLMEFVFALEDHFHLTIPEERLDPRQVELTLADLCQALEEAIARQPAPAA